MFCKLKVINLIQQQDRSELSKNISMIGGDCNNNGKIL